MKVKVFSIAPDSISFMSDQNILNDFLSKVNFIKSDTHYIESEIDSWSILVHYEDKTITSVAADKVATPVSEQFQESDLNPEQLETYKKLKKWRLETAENKNIAPFMVCHNSELMHISIQNPQSILHLKKIKGFGNLKSEKFGEAILEILSA